MYFELKENKPHGTPENPFSLYHIQNVNHAFQIPVHWHDELEIIYVRSGSLNVNISGENYVGTPGDAFAFYGIAFTGCGLLYLSLPIGIYVFSDE